MGKSEAKGKNYRAEEENRSRKAVLSLGVGTVFPGLRPKGKSQILNQGQAGEARESIP
jgi:hypothetical protein